MHVVLQVRGEPGRRRFRQGSEYICGRRAKQEQQEIGRSRKSANVQSCHQTRGICVAQRMRRRLTRIKDTSNLHIRISRPSSVSPPSARPATPSTFALDPCSQSQPCTNHHSRSPSSPGRSLIDCSKRLSMLPRATTTTTTASSSKTPSLLQFERPVQNRSTQVWRQTRQLMSMEMQPASMDSSVRKRFPCTHRCCSLR